MSFFIPILTIILATLILTSLQLVPGVFALFYHYALGKNSTKKAHSLSPYFILGHATFLIIIWLLIYSFIFVLCYNLSNEFINLTIYIIAGLLFAESLLSFFRYYQKGTATELFISRTTAKALTVHAENSKTASDIFTLGFFSGIPELLFAAPIFAISSLALMQIDINLRPLILSICVVLALLPLFIILQLYRSDRNLANLERLRVHLKPIFRLIICLSFLGLAIAGISLGVISHG